MYSRISPAKNGRAAIRYAEGAAHNGHAERNLRVIPINLLPNGRYAEQMEPLWRKARKNHSVQIRRIIISFSKNEIEPENAEDLEKACYIAKSFTQEYYPNRQAVLYFQKDGKGGCLHCHILVNDVSLFDHKGCSRKQQNYLYVRNGIDAEASKLIDLDYGSKTASRQSRTERVKTQAENLTVPNVLQSHESNGKSIGEKTYSYIDDMKSRIEQAATAAKDDDTFLKRLHAAGIAAMNKTSKKYGAYILYDFFDCPVKVKNRKARSYRLGFAYGPEGIRSLWNKRLHHNTQEKSDEAIDRLAGDPQFFDAKSPKGTVGATKVRHSRNEVITASSSRQSINKKDAEKRLNQVRALISASAALLTSISESEMDTELREKEIAITKKHLCRQKEMSL